VGSDGVLLSLASVPSRPSHTRAPHPGLGQSRVRTGGDSAVWRLRLTSSPEMIDRRVLPAGEAAWS
jgi:hypothetical protein